MVILYEGNHRHPRFPLFDILVPWRSLNYIHRHIVQRNNGAERKRRRLVEEEERDVTSKAFSSYERPLYMLTSFRYLGWVMSVTYDDWAAVVRNLYRAMVVLKNMTVILRRDRAEPWVSGFFL